MIWINKFIVLVVFLVFNYTVQAEIGATYKSLPVVGHAPYMKSIGSLLSPTNVYVYDLSGQPITTTYSLIYVPSKLCQMTQEERLKSELLPFFNFIDDDLDTCDTEYFDRLNWYILEPIEGSWDTVNRWDDLQATEITNQRFPGSILPVGQIPESAQTPVLRVPTAALGKRIGFTYRPISTTGVPNEGGMIEAWNLDYFWGQEKPLASIPSNIHNSIKLESISVPSGGGIIEEYNRPIIKNARIKGTFGLNQRLEVDYNFYSMDDKPFEDVSRIWWGKENTTAQQAVFDNPNYSLDRISAPLTIEDIGGIYEVAILPIKKEQERLVVSPVVFVKSNDPKNELNSALSITDLNFSDKIKINQSISATYQFNHDDMPGIIDKSTYIWGYLNALTNKFMEVSRGEVLNSGVVPESPIISIDLAGRTFELRMIPRDNFDRKGVEVSISDKAEDLTALRIEPNELIFKQGDNASQTLTAMAEFSHGSDIDVSQLGVWSLDDDRLSIDQKGSVSIQEQSDVSFNAVAQFKYGTQQASADVSFVIPPVLVLDIIQDKAIAAEEVNIIKATVTDSKGNPLVNQMVNFSAFNKDLVFSPASAHTDINGQIHVSISKLSQKYGTETITASIPNFNLSQSLVVTFLELTKVYKINAPRGKEFSHLDGFPTTGFENATFQILASSSVANHSLDWYVNEDKSVFVDNEGNVTLKEASHKKNIKITAKNFTHAYRYEFRVDKWFTQPITTKYDPGVWHCANQGADIPTRLELSLGKNNREIGSLWSEWGKPAGWSQAKYSHFWSKTENSLRKVYMIDIETGDNSVIKANDGAYVEHLTCIKS